AATRRYGSATAVESSSAPPLEGRRAGLGPPFVTTPIPPRTSLHLFHVRNQTAVRRVSGGAQGAGQLGWQRGQYQVPRPAARIFSIGVPQRSHGSPVRP